MVRAAMVRTVVTAALLAAVWVAWSWHFEPLIVGFGVVAVVITVLLARRLGVLDEETAPFELNVRLFVYLPWLMWQVLKANLQTARLILHPKMPIRPHLIRLRADQRTTLGKVIFANTITITPGTISLDLNNGVILVHCLDDAMASEDDSGATSRMVHWLERRVTEDARRDGSGPNDESSSSPLVVEPLVVEPLVVEPLVVATVEARDTTNTTDTTAEATSTDGAHKSEP